MPSVAPRPLRHGLLALLTLAALAAALLAPTPAPPAAAAPGSDRFWAGQVYTGEFGAPSILRSGGLWYAYATNLDGNNLPVMTSPDLKTWTAREAWPLEAGYHHWVGYNDAMPRPASWAAELPPNGKPGVWSPGVAKLAGRFVNAYAVQASRGSNRHCLTLATAPHPAGPFVDTSSKPLYCSSDPMGSIDPAWLKHRGKVYLVWKNAGVPGSKPTQILSRQMTADGSQFLPGSKTKVLLQTAHSWEGNVIEAPSPVRYGGKIYLFYSGHKYTTSKYAIGYAVCSGPLGPCKRPVDKPLLDSDSAVAGPGAQTPVVDDQGRLKLAYSAWRTGHVGYQKNPSCRTSAEGCNQRRLYVATLKVTSGGELRVTDRR